MRAHVDMERKQSDIKEQQERLRWVPELFLILIIMVATQIYICVKIDRTLHPSPNKFYFIII